MQVKYYFSLLLMSSGAILLLKTLDLFEYDLNFAKDYWAISLIAFGLSVVIENKVIKSIIMSLLGIFSSLILISLYDSINF